jgi:hypothetical protein
VVSTTRLLPVRAKASSSTAPTLPLRFLVRATSVTLGLRREQFVACTRSVAQGHVRKEKDKAEVVGDNKAFEVSDESTLTSLDELEALNRLNCVELAKVQRRSGPTIYTVRERAWTTVKKGKEQHGM